MADKIEIIRLFKDWRKSELIRKGDEYPIVPMMPLDLPILAFPEVEKYLRERIAIHKKAYEQSDTELPLCTSKEMWEQPATYAVFKRGATSGRAVRVFDSYREADNFIGAQTLTYEVIERRGKRTRCEGYCPAAPFCSQYRQYLQGQNNV